MEKVDVNPLEIKDFALSLGWKLVKEALKDGLFVLDSPNGDNTQLIFPKDESLYEYQEMGMISLRRLSEYYKTTLSEIKEEVREVNDDVIALRYFSDNKNINYISFQEALASIDATKQMLLAATSSVINPVTFHPKLNRKEAQDLLKKTRFRHTEEGSFILKLSVPFDYNELQGDLYSEGYLEKPLGRKAVELINESSLTLLGSIEVDTIGELYQTQVESYKPFISYNFCDALFKLFDDERELPFQLIFHWSKASRLKLQMPQLNNKITFPYSLKRKIEEAREVFAPKRKDTKGNFVATVETLDGSVGEDGKRYGVVILSVLFENEVIKARVTLPSNFYDIAVDAHKNGGAYVELAGILKKGKAIYTIEYITNFKLLS